VNLICPQPRTFPGTFAGILSLSLSLRRKILKYLRAAAAKIIYQQFFSSIPWLPFGAIAIAGPTIYEHECNPLFAWQWPWPWQWNIAIGVGKTEGSRPFVQIIKQRSW